MADVKKRRKTKPAQERFFAKVSGGDIDTCWEWTAARTSGGYGNFWSGERYRPAHRWSYEFFHGPIPMGLHLDHLCRNHACVNPWHLEPVTCLVNILRGDGPAATRRRYQGITHCQRGHEFTPENILIGSDGYRRCDTCYRAAPSQVRVRII